MRFERRAAHFHQAIQLVGLVDAVRPLIDLRVRVGVLVRHVAQILRPCIVQDFGQRRRLVRAGRELSVAVVDRDLVPVADPRLIRVATDRSCRPRSVSRADGGNPSPRSSPSRCRSSCGRGRACGRPRAPTADGSASAPSRTAPPASRCRSCTATAGLRRSCSPGDRAATRA